jgi:hypothetical protein
MKRILTIEAGAMVYAGRKGIVNRVFRQIKQVRGFRRFSLPYPRETSNRLEKPLDIIARHIPPAVKQLVKTFKMATASATREYSSDV